MPTSQAALMSPYYISPRVNSLAYVPGWPLFATDINRDRNLEYFQELTILKHVSTENCSCVKCKLSVFIKTIMARFFFVEKLLDDFFHSPNRGLVVLLS